jgi:hypothetical protein
LNSRWIRRAARQALGVFCEVVVPACRFVCEVILLVSDVVDFVASNIEAGMKGMLVSIATNVKFAMEMILEVMAPDDEDEEAEQRCRTTIADVERNSRYSSAVVETRRRAKGRAERLRVETSLEDDPNRNWSNEHGNLSPESSPHTRSFRVLQPPYRRVRDLVASGHASSSYSAKPSTASKSDASDVKDVLSVPRSATFERTWSCSPKWSDSTFSGGILTPLETRPMTDEEYMAWCSVGGIIRGGFGAGLDSTSVSTPGLKVVHTPTASSSSSEAIDTPSSSASSRGGVNTPASTRTPDSEDSSRPDTPDSTSSSGSESTVIRTPSP